MVSIWQLGDGGARRSPEELGWFFGRRFQVFWQGDDGLGEGVGGVPEEGGWGGFAGGPPGGNPRRNGDLGRFHHRLRETGGRTLVVCVRESSGQAHENTG